MLLHGGLPFEERAAQHVNFFNLKILLVSLTSSSLTTVEKVWLRGGKFLAGRQTPSIADLLYTTELEQLMLCDKVSLRRMGGATCILALSLSVLGSAKGGYVHVIVI